MNDRNITAILASFLCLALSTAAAAADAPSQATSGSATEELADARETVREAADVVEQLRSDPETRETLKKANAVFIVPDYGRAALGVGGAGGEGVLIARNDGTWSAPAFYNIGAVNLGLEAGVEVGSIAFFIMSDDAMEGFRNENNFSLNADAGLTIINWSARAQASAGKGADVIAWSDTEGLYGDLAVSVSDIFWDGEANRAFYQQATNAREIISGNVKAPEAASELQAEFAALESGEPSRPATPEPGQE